MLCFVKNFQHNILCFTVDKNRGGCYNKAPKSKTARQLTKTRIDARKPRGITFVVRLGYFCLMQNSFFIFLNGGKWKGLFILLKASAR